MTEGQKTNTSPQEPTDFEAAEAPVHANEDTPESGSFDERIGQLEEEVTRFKDLYLRAMAETENVRARSRREIDDTAKYATTKFARDIVSVVENLQRASASITAEARAENETLRQVGEGIDMSMQELLSIFERNGIKRINPQGQKFDHNLHQAVAQVQSADMAPGSVVQVLQAGYMLNDRLLKPAMVTVAAAANPGNAENTSA